MVHRLQWVGMAKKSGPLFVPVCDDCGWSMDTKNGKRADAELVNHRKTTNHTNVVLKTYGPYK